MSEEKEVKKVKGVFIHEELISQIVGYMMGRPYGEVASLMESIKNSEVIEREIKARPKDGNDI